MLNIRANCSRLTPVLVVLFIVTGTISCRGTDSGRPGVSYPIKNYESASEVCGLLTPRDLEFALGFQFEKGVDKPTADFRLGERLKSKGRRGGSAYLSSFSDLPGMTKCYYMTKGGVSAVETGIAVVYAENLWKRVVSHHHRRLAKVPGLGDQALVNRSTGIVLVLDRGLILGIDVGKMSPVREEDRSFERALRLARRALHEIRS